MKNNMLLIIMFITFCSCRNNSHNGVEIRASSDTVNIGMRYIAELYVPYKPPVSPIFFIVKNGDTVQLPFDTNKKCAIYRAVGGEKGEKICNGYVEYINQNGRKEKKSFLIKFYVNSVDR